MSMSTDRTPLKRTDDDIERLEYYQQGGYHPIQIGDHLRGRRYRIVHKLGHRSHSTFWLARDEQLTKYVAIKVGIAADVDDGNSNNNNKEIDILHRLADHPSGEKNLGRALIPSVLDHFHVHGPNGTHACLVTSPAKCSLADAIVASDYKPFRTDVARSLAAQLAIAVAHIHSLGFVHGDLHFGNLLLPLPAEMIDDLTDKQLYDLYGSPDPELFPPEEEDEEQVLPSTGGVPTYVYPPIWMGKPSNEISLGESRLLLADFGAAFRPDEESRFDSYTPLEIRPPEARFEPTKPLTFASDIWSLGCMIWATLGLKPFFGGVWLSGPESAAAAAQMDALGPMSDEWWEKWEAKTKTESFDGNGKPKAARTQGDAWTMERRLEDSIQQQRAGMEMITEDERRAIIEMTRSMLKFRPCGRLSAQQVLETEWMRKWAIPEAEKAWGNGLPFSIRYF